MSKASEWARRAVQTDAVQPKFECSCVGFQWLGFDLYTDDDGEKHEPEIKVQYVGIVNRRGQLVTAGRTLDAGDACAFARWILHVFGNAAESPAERSGARP